MSGYFLLTAGQDYYPGGGDSNWIGTYPTREAAEAVVEKNRAGESCWGKYLVPPPNKPYYPQDVKIGADWYEIIDLREWIKENES